MKYDREYLKKVLNDNGYNPIQFEQKWYEFALLLIIAENTTPKIPDVVMPTIKPVIQTETIQTSTSNKSNFNIKNSKIS